MVRLEDVVEIKRDIEVLLLEEDKEIESIKNIIQKADRAGAVNTAGMMKVLLGNEMREKEGLKKLVALYAQQEQSLGASVRCPEDKYAVGCPPEGYEVEERRRHYGTRHRYSGYATREGNRYSGSGYSGYAGVRESRSYAGNRYSRYATR